jgi:hypothetical protein
LGFFKVFTHKKTLLKNEKGFQKVFAIN